MEPAQYDELVRLAGQGAELIGRMFPSCIKPWAHDTAITERRRYALQAEVVASAWGGDSHRDMVAQAFAPPLEELAKGFYARVLFHCGSETLPTGPWSQMEIAKAIAAAEEEYTRQAGGTVLKELSSEGTANYADLQTLDAKGQCAKAAVDIISNVVQQEILYLRHHPGTPPLWNAAQASTRAERLAAEWEPYQQTFDAMQELGSIIQRKASLLARLSPQNAAICNKLEKLSLGAREAGIV